MRGTVAVVCVVALSGCSLLLVHGPSANQPPNVMPICDTSNALPAVDAVIGGLTLLGSLGALVDPSQGETAQERSDRHTTAVSAIVLGAGFLGSAILGGSRTSACSDAREAYLASYQRAPQGYPPPGYAPQGYPGYPQGYAPPPPVYPPQGSPQGYAPPPPGYPPPAPAGPAPVYGPPAPTQPGAR